ncbi:DUF5819 family protein [Streptomyces sp. NPDC002742]|uniref:DUF5819 family protein n=1 Tax=Streptomyces sp. NPDC002742 TaxID=3364663 RepID=UPI0036BA32BE
MDMEARERLGAVPDERREPHEPGRPSTLRGPFKAGLWAAIALCLTTVLIHVLLVFLHVAPENAVSQRYRQQVDSWVYPLFEQNWRLFAPNPESVNSEISVRTRHAGPDGSAHVSPWFDITAVDESAVEHNPFPSHTNQNMLRRAWSSYLQLYGGADKPPSERAIMMQKYLRNIAADRVAAHRQGGFEALQLRVVTVPVPASRAPDGTGPAPAPINTRYLPWWKVSSHHY